MRPRPSPTAGSARYAARRWPWPPRAAPTAPPTWAPSPRRRSHRRGDRTRVCHGGTTVRHGRCYMAAANEVRFIRPEGAMGTLLEVARHALEGVEVLVALATTGLLG